MSAFGTDRSMFLVPASPKDRRPVRKWVLIGVAILLVLAVINHRWVRFQLNVLAMKIGSATTREQTLQWFIENEPKRARDLFFQTMMEDPDLRPLAAEGLEKSDQRELVPVYLYLWRDKSLEPAIRDTALELLAKHAGRHAFFLFLDPSMVLSGEPQYWGASYDYLNANLSPEDVDLLISQYYVGNTRTRLSVITAFSYLKENSLTHGHQSLRSMLLGAMESPNPEIRFRAIQTLGCVARAEDIPAVLLHLRDPDEQITTAAGRLLTELHGARPRAKGSRLNGLRRLALAAAKIQQNGYPHEVVYQLGFDSLLLLRSLMDCGRQEDADALATRLAARTRQILDDIYTRIYRASVGSTFERSVLPTWFSGEVTRSKNFGVVLSPAGGKVNYGQILQLGVGRVIYCVDVESWDRDEHLERKRFLLHRRLAQTAGLEQGVRVCVSEDVLEKSGLLLSVFNRVLSASRFGRGGRTGFFEISLDPGADPVRMRQKFACGFRDATIAVRRVDPSIRMFVGTVVLGDRRWYGPEGALDKLLRQKFDNADQLRQYIDGISIQSDLPPALLEAELEHFLKSLDAAPSGTRLWCTHLGQHYDRLRSTAARLERDHLSSMSAAADLPACVSLLAKAGVTSIFFAPLKDTPVPGDPKTVSLNGLLYRDCMPKPLYHAATLLTGALGECDLASVQYSVTEHGARIAVFPGAPRPVVVAWADRAGLAARLQVGSPVVRVTSPVPDGVGNLRATFVHAVDNKVLVPLTRTAIVMEELDSGPAPHPDPLPVGSFDIATALRRLSSPLSSCERSYGSHDRSGGNDDGFSGTSSYLYRNESGEYVIFDARGPGVVKRLWMGRTADISRIRFYFDAGPAPGIDMTPAQMFEGKKLPFRSPLVARAESAGGGSISYLPLWFSKRIVIATVGMPRFFQVDYALLDPSTEVESTTARKLRARSAELASLAARLAPEPGGRHAYCTPYSITKEVKLDMGDKVEVATLTGPAMIRCLRLRCANPDYMAQVLLQIRWDGQTAAGVGSPLAYIFGQAHGKRDWQGLPIGCVKGEGYIHFPMPFKKSAQIVLTNSGSQTVKVFFAVSVTKLATPEAVERYFCCQWRTAQASPGTHLRLLSINGAGHLAGCMLSLHAPGTCSYLDSDVLVFTDGALHPLVHSTGTDDYFGGGNFYEGGSFSLPCSGLLSKREGTTLQYRFNITDAIPFRRSLRMLIEEPPPAVKEVRFSAAFFWYSSSPAGGD